MGRAFGTSTACGSSPGAHHPATRRPAVPPSTTDSPKVSARRAFLRSGFRPHSTEEAACAA